MRLQRPAHCCSQRPRLRQRQRLLLPPVLAPAFAARPAATASRHSPSCPLQRDTAARAGRPRNDGAAAVEPPPQQEDQDEEQQEEDLNEPFVGSTRTPRDPKLTAPLVLERGAPEVPYVRLVLAWTMRRQAAAKVWRRPPHTHWAPRAPRSQQLTACIVCSHRTAQPGEYQQTLVASFTLGGVGLHTGQDGAWRAAP